MTLPSRAVIVKQLPEWSDARSERAFLADLANSMVNVIRPSIVLDCSAVRRMDSSMLSLIARCLEETMKRNGDVRLAAVGPEAWPILQSIGLGRLFRIFGTSTEAADSFRRAMYESASDNTTPGAGESASAHAA